MVLVPADSFIMGSDKGQTNELPQRKLDLRAFYIDLHEVSNAEYSKFLLATRPRFIPPPGWADFNPPKGKENFAVANITAYEADAYAQWAGKRLPTEEEWEKAARGKDGRLYPWGDRWDPEMGAASVAPRDVNRFPNAASPYGCIGMAGNVREWTASPYTLALKSEPGIPFFLTPFAYLFNGITLKTKYAKQVATLESLGGAATDDRVVKGGPTNLRAAFECRCSCREDYEASTREETLGFRCAKDAL
jgi:formylglycine-generating enzyme required for sulfatase activity